MMRELRLSDLENYGYWLLPIHRYHLLNGPYFKKRNKAEVDEYVSTLRKRLLKGEMMEDRRCICNEKDEVIGEVSWYWKSEETQWMEIGIVLFDEKYWGKGIGFEALKWWIDHLFEKYDFLVRIGLTTWSGNNGMMRLSEKLGMQKEAQYRKARIVNGEYYDSISYGILKEEWQTLDLK